MLHFRRFLASVHSPELLSRFTAPVVQTLLRNLTRPDFDKIAKEAASFEKTKAIPYRFLTDAELNVAREKAKRKIDEMLQMPLVLDPNADSVDRIISTDPDLESFDQSKMVFIDISMSAKEMTRSVTSRNTDGSLRHVNLRDQRRIINSIYEMEGRSPTPPPALANDEMLSRLLEANEHRYALDWACVQFEPDDPIFVSITNKVYDDIDKRGIYSTLLGTRHYGGLVFYLTSLRNHAKLLASYIKDKKFQDTVWLLQLHTTLHNDLSEPADGSIESLINTCMQLAELLGGKSLDIIQKSLERVEETIEK